MQARSTSKRARRSQNHVLIVLAGLLVVALAACEINLDPLKGTLSGSPLDELPDHIRLVNDFGMRPVWSPDGEHIAFLDANVGDVYELAVETGSTRKLTGHFAHAGFTRAHYLPNGDLVLCGPSTELDADEAARFESVLWLLAAPYDGTPTPLFAPCWEGIAVSHTDNQVAWADSEIDFGISDPLLLIVNLLTARSEIWTGEIVYDAAGAPQLTDRRRVLQRGDISPVAVMEPQDFRPPQSTELIIAVYAYKGTEALGVDLDTGELSNYSRSPVYYEEPEGISPDGTSILVERAIGIVLFPVGLDIWSLSLDGETRYERLTEFVRYKGYGASNPTVSPDGTKIAFQLSVVSDDPADTGKGNGILLYDLE